MLRYIGKRLLQIIPTFLLLTLLVYVILALSPSDPVAVILGGQGTEEQIMEVREQLGLNDSIPVRYVKYMWNLLHGEMGISWVSQNPVYKEFSQRLPNTLILTGMALALTIVIGQDYIRTANAKGASKIRVIFYHALRNGLLPVITNIGNNVGGIVAGAVTVETIFAVPGIGSMLVSAVRTSDIPAVMGPIIFISLLVCVINLLVDLLYALIDPRVKLQYTK